MAEFDSTGALLKAAEKLHDAGYTKFDCHSPFPIHGMDTAMGLNRSPVGYIAGISAFLGGSFGMWMQWYTSTVDYRMVIAGKPFFSFPAYIPVAFAITILFAALGAVFGFMITSGLPRLHHPVFYSSRFHGFSDDRFFVSLDSNDPKYNEFETISFLKSIGSIEVEVLKGE